jgi:hypothetical protein
VWPPPNDEAALNWGVPRAQEGERAPACRIVLLTNWYRQPQWRSCFERASKMRSRLSRLCRSLSSRNPSPTLVFHSGTCRVPTLRPPTLKVPVWNVSRSKTTPCGGKVATPGTRRECRPILTPWNPSRTLNRGLPRVKVAILERVASLAFFLMIYSRPAYRL